MIVLGYTHIVTEAFFQLPPPDPADHNNKEPQ